MLTIIAETMPHCYDFHIDFVRSTHKDQGMRILLENVFFVFIWPGSKYSSDEKPVFDFAVFVANLLDLSYP